MPFSSSIEHLWHQFASMHHIDSSPMLAPQIIRSWQRSHAARVPLNAQPQIPAMFVLQNAQRELLALAQPAMEDLYQFVEGSRCGVLLADANVTMLMVLGDADLVERAAESAIQAGASLQEAAIGTCAVNLALHEAQPIQTTGYEHYSAHLHPFACAAAPLFDIDGQAMGVLGVLGFAADAHPHTLGMVIAAAQALHAQIRSNVLLSETHLHLAELNAAIESMSEGLIMVDPQGRVSKINPPAGHLLNLSVPRAAGRPLNDLLELPPPLRQAIEQRTPLTDQEFVFAGRKGTVAAICNLRPVTDQERRYLGTLLMLRGTETIHRLVQQVVGARAHFTFADVLGDSPLLHQTLRQCRSAATSLNPVLLLGEPGVGKRLLAHAIHNGGQRVDGPFIELNCDSVPRTLLMNELLGQEGEPRHAGRLELAQGGTLLLESIESLSVEAQTALLRSVETGHLVRIGGKRAIPLNVRIIATASPLIARDVLDSRFRSELYGLFSSSVIEVFPLRRRGDDTLLLINELLVQSNRRQGKHVHLAPDALAALVAYDWPGNIRELEATLERIVDRIEKPVVQLDDLPLHIAQAVPPSPLMRQGRLYDRHITVERDAIVRAGRATGGHLGRAAERLGISRATLWRRMKLYNIHREQFWKNPMHDEL